MPTKVDTHEDRMSERARLDKLATEYITGEYERTMEAIDNYDLDDVEDPKKITDLLADAKSLLTDLNNLGQNRALDNANFSLPDNIPPREWLIDKWLPANCLSMITGAGGVGKSYAALQISAALTNGVTDEYIFTSDPEATSDIQRPACNVVYAAWEDELDEVQRRLKHIAKELKWVDKRHIEERFTFIDMKGHGPIWGPEFGVHIASRARLLDSGYQLMHIAQDKTASLLILDPGAGAFGANENDRAAVREYAAYLSHWGHEKNCAVLILAHPPKNGESYSGSTDWLGSVRSMWEIAYRTATASHYYSIRHTKSNYALTQPERYMKKAETSGVWIETKSLDAASITPQNTPDESEVNHETPSITEEDL